MSPVIGVIADDVTGACDLADAARNEGARVLVSFGTPRPHVDVPAADVVVIALRTRTAARSEAVDSSVAAARWLLDHGASALYQKYCSTYDSTDAGMIGPVADALCAMLGGGAGSIGTPATPRSGRTQYQAHLFVGAQLLSESPMRDHPLTPMRDSDLVGVLARQSDLPVHLVPWQRVVEGPDAVAQAIAEITRGGPAHVLVDAIRDADLDTLARAVDLHSSTLLCGAAGFAAALSRRNHGGRLSGDDGLLRIPARRALIVSGSCSARTRSQVAAFAGPRITLDPIALAEDADTFIAEVLRTIAELPATTPVLVSSSADPAVVGQAQARLGAARAASILEDAAGRIAADAVRDLGVNRIIVAGGETSGAVVSALKLGLLRVGPSVAPGVPWMVPYDGADLAILLKSGNFGPVDLFNSAWKVLPI